MATGTEMYNAVKQATTDHKIGAEFAIHPVDAIDLMKLKPSDLKKLGYDDSVADEVSSALFKADYGPLGRTMGIRFVFNPDATRNRPD